jgi:hypothetical protein
VGEYTSSGFSQAHVAAPAGRKLGIIDCKRGCKRAWLQCLDMYMHTCFTYPRRQRVATGTAFNVHRLGDELEDEDTIAIDVSLDGEYVMSLIFWRCKSSEKRSKCRGASYQN